MAQSHEIPLLTYVIEMKKKKNLKLAVVKLRMLFNLASHFSQAYKGSIMTFSAFLLFLFCFVLFLFCFVLFFFFGLFCFFFFCYLSFRFGHSKYWRRRVGLTTSLNRVYPYVQVFLIRVKLKIEFLKYLKTTKLNYNKMRINEARKLSNNMSDDNDDDNEIDDWLREYLFWSCVIIIMLIFKLF